MSSIFIYKKSLIGYCKKHISTVLAAKLQLFSELCKHLSNKNQKKSKKHPPL